MSDVPNPPRSELEESGSALRRFHDFDTLPCAVEYMEQIIGARDMAKNNLLAIDALDEKRTPMFGSQNRSQIQILLQVAAVPRTRAAIKAQRYPVGRHRDVGRGTIIGNDDRREAGAGVDLVPFHMIELLRAQSRFCAAGSIASPRFATIRETSCRKL